MFVRYIRCRAKSAHKYVKRKSTGAFLRSEPVHVRLQDILDLPNLHRCQFRSRPRNCEQVDALVSAREVHHHQETVSKASSTSLLVASILERWSSSNTDQREIYFCHLDIYICNSNHRWLRCPSSIIIALIISKISLHRSAVFDILL